MDVGSHLRTRHLEQLTVLLAEKQVWICLLPLKESALILRNGPCDAPIAAVIEVCEPVSQIEVMTARVAEGLLLVVWHCNHCRDE